MTPEETIKDLDPDLYEQEPTAADQSPRSGRSHDDVIRLDVPSFSGGRRHSMDDLIKRASPTSSTGDSGVQINKPEARKYLSSALAKGRSGSFSVSSSPAERKRNESRPRALTLVPGELGLMGGRSPTGLLSPPSSAHRPSMDYSIFGVSKSRNLSFAGDTMNLDSVSVDDLYEADNDGKKKVLKKNLTVIFSCIYAVLIVVIGGVLYVTNQNIGKFPSEMFNVTMVSVGFSWLGFLHWDLHRYKSHVLKKMRERHEQWQAASQPEADSYSTSTEFIFNQSWNTSPAYFFLRGRHSGSFYLKAGMAVFCFGHLINKGLLLTEQIMYFAIEEKTNNGCASATAVAQNIFKPVYSFYQLFVVFKYSNIIINRYKGWARFGLMHCIATCLCFWFNTIVEDAMEHYNHQKHLQHDKMSARQTTHHFENTTETPQYNFMETVFSFSAAADNSSSRQFSCKGNTFFDSANVQAIPYLYPFTIEYNIILAAVWYIVWQNIGNEHGKADPHHFEHRQSSVDDMVYQSNLVISADCHSANKGLFAGLFMLLCTIVSVIVFFVAIAHNSSARLGITMYSAQELSLNALALIGIILAYSRLCKLDINSHPITFLDDVLLFVPLPFFFCNSLLSAMAELHSGDHARVAVHFLVMVQVIIQTPCIIDGLRRCSDNKVLQYQKPGRELVTFLIVLNICIWIINTFEQKNVEPLLGQNKYYGDVVSVFIGHTTHPLMLFYRFHSSVCLADIWKSAYEKGE